MRAMSSTDSIDLDMCVSSSACKNADLRYGRKRNILPIGPPPFLLVQDQPGRRSAVLHTQLFENVLQMLLDGEGTDPQDLPDFGIGLSFTSPGRDLGLPPRESQTLQ